MKDLMTYTYLLDNVKIKKELEKLWGRYNEIIMDNLNPSWEEINEARSILYLTGQIYCEQIAVRAIERRLHLLKTKISLIEFFDLIDKNSPKLIDLRKDELFSKLEEFYRIVKDYKNKYTGGKYYLDEERFIDKYHSVNPEKDFNMGYKGKF